MSLFKKEVKRIIADQDVRDPRATLLAIEKLLDAKITGPKKPKPFFSVSVFDDGRVVIASTDVDALNLKGWHATRDALQQYAVARTAQLIEELGQKANQNDN